MSPWHQWTDNYWKHRTRQIVIWKCSLEVHVEEVQGLRNPLHSFPRVAIVFPLSDLPQGSCATQADLHKHGIEFVGLFLLLKQAGLLKEANQAIPFCSSVLVVNFLPTKDGAEHTETKYKPIYTVSDLNHSASPSYVYMNNAYGWEVILHTHYKDLCTMFS